MFNLFLSFSKARIVKLKSNNHRDRLRESPVSTKYIDVTVEPSYYSNNNSSYSDVEEEPSEFIESFPAPVQTRRQSIPEVKRPNGFTEFEASVEGPINPVNYGGTQVNVWGIPPGNLSNLFQQPKRDQQPQLGYLTDQMIQNLNEKKTSQNESKSSRKVSRK